MKLLKGLCVFLICATASAQDIDNNRENQEEGRGLGGYNQEWRAVDYFSPTSDSSGWVPQSDTDDGTPKRRRIRKRKRRPPVFTEDDWPKKTKEPWEEMSEENTQKTNTRRRLTPIYEEKIRDPFTALQEAEEKQKTKVDESSTKTPDLKTILKNSGGLSLSEVLQQKNLSLTELLKGNREAISALAKEAETTTEVYTYRRLPPSIGLKKDINRNFERESAEHLSSDEVVEAQRKRLALLHGHRDTEVTAGVPAKAVTVSLDEILSVFKNESDGPLKMTIDLDEMTVKKPPTTEQSAGKKLKNVTAKEEIMEILQNPVERENLSRILRSRNMTVEELVQQRERGSSQLHLADIFHNKTREPEPQEEHVGHINPASFRKPKTIPEFPETTKPPYTITSFPTYKIETNKNALPVWRQLYPSFFPDVYQNSNQADKKEIRPTTSTEKLDYEEIERLEEIENTLAEAANGRLKVDVPQNVYEEEFLRMPAGVKSAILASLAIIGLSLLVFLTILVVFKWTQKQKRRLNYSAAFAGSKIKSPILEPEQRRTFKTFVCETLGRKKNNYYKSHLHSMSDSIWDSEKKPYMI
ncbi:hypothetical protein TcasGA2_TC008197 [Tribolium castaneum]|uniref:Uncharacterized protein n=1 Tax=Tribolium castaneum TaxID=7070 RepID=D2A0D8_TRICA|nr:PREDICTED: uncharacterized protein LOC103312702 [Tribolium castaneum]EFA02501.1 hypothetical protein TcasGA2_TC008197 [Tribolium castaneum]|eukprot:XP_008192295.1 PREDICTED: uncharacterized protein LOC103312702 [Tribolium castaneum]